MAGRNVPLPGLGIFLDSCEEAIERVSAHLLQIVRLEDCRITRVDLAQDVPVVSAGAYIASLRAKAPANKGKRSDEIGRGTNQSASLTLTGRDWQTHVYDKTRESGGIRAADGLELARIELRMKAGALRGQMGLEDVRTPDFVAQWLHQNAREVYFDRTAWTRIVPTYDREARIGQLIEQFGPVKATYFFAVEKLLRDEGALSVQACFGLDPRQMAALKNCGRSSKGRDN